MNKSNFSTAGGWGHYSTSKYDPEVLRIKADSRRRKLRTQRRICRIKVRSSKGKGRKVQFLLVNLPLQNIVPFFTLNI